MDKLGKIRRQHLKERLKISKIAKFESDLVKTGDDIAPQSGEILQTFVWWGHKLRPLNTHQFKFGNLTNFKALFPVVLTGFSSLDNVKS